MIQTSWRNRSGEKSDYRSRLDVIRNPQVNYMSRTRTKTERRASKDAGEGPTGRRKKKAYDGAYVAEPRRQVQSGFNLAGRFMQHIHDWVIDMDLTSLYPSIMLILNLSPKTFVSKLFFQEKIQIPMYDYIKFIDKEDKDDYKINSNDFFLECYSGKHWWAMLELFMHMKTTDEILSYIDDHQNDFT